MMPALNGLYATYAGCKQIIWVEKNSGPARNRTWIWSFGNSYTIHCTTRPLCCLRFFERFKVI